MEKKEVLISLIIRVTKTSINIFFLNVREQDLNKPQTCKIEIQILMIPEMAWFVDEKCNTSFLNSQTKDEKKYIIINKFNIWRKCKYT